jgi:hypothetical protein
MDEGLLPVTPNPTWHRLLGFNDFTAKFPGVCAICDCAIEPGHKITTVEKANVESYAHASCLD